MSGELAIEWIVYICAWCDEPLDYRSARMIARDLDPRRISHGICRACARQNGIPLDDGPREIGADV